MIITVVFDLDDTLYDEIDYCKSGFTAVAKHLCQQPDLPVLTSEQTIFDSLWTEFTAGNRTTVFNKTLEQFGIKYDRRFIEGLVGIYRNHRPAITLPQDSKEVLDILHTQYTLAMLTDGFLPAQQLKTQALGIQNFFRCIIYTEALGREFWKPSPKGFMQILKKLDVKSQNCVYIADNPKKDFIAPNKLGFCTIQLIRPQSLHSHNPPTRPDGAAGHVIDSITKLPALLNRL